MNKRIGFLSFGHYGRIPGTSTPTARDALTQTVELAVAAEELGIDGAWIRVHHFQRQFASPWPLLAAMGARTRRIELGTGVIDMRYENPLAMAEQSAAADLISGGRLQLGISRGSQEPALRGYESYGHFAPEGGTDADLAREHAARYRTAIDGGSVAFTDPKATGVRAGLAVQPQSEGLSQRIWWGSSTRSSARWAGEQGMNLMSSTLLSEDTGIPFAEAQAEQIDVFRSAWRHAGHTGEPRTSVARSVLPITTERDRQMFGADMVHSAQEQVGVLGGAVSRFGKSFIGEPDRIAQELSDDAAVRAADTLLLTIPNQLGVDENLRLLTTIAQTIAPAIGWQPSTK
ncbi:LLM class flavin-dependent oxidoreductase [Micromonospora arida]|uniref:LLM class flavin-dependent oxidoreductase n=1 Tax=Micromonospora arida TaxID=2203715 RepID=UPI0033BB697A